MTIEQQISDLTVATTALLAAVNVSKTVLDAAVAAAADSETAAGEHAATAIERAAVAVAASQTAADAVYAQLQAIKAQTEAARDQALDGLGAADNSQILAELLGAISWASDIAGQAVREVLRAESALIARAGAVENNVATYDAAITHLVYALTQALDLAGVTARAISGGDVIVRQGSTLPPPVSPAGDRDTGLQFPAADVIALLTAGLERLRIDSAGRVGIGTNAPSGLLDVADDKIRIRSPRTPASASAPGGQGEIAWDSNFVYVCVATNAWRRAALTTW
jgi:hypothetical protein